jgi:hypothetical protein
MGDLVPVERLLIKMIHKEAKQEVKRIYQQTAGYQDPEIPTEEQRQMLEDGVLEP